MKPNELTILHTTVALHVEICSKIPSVNMSMIETLGSLSKYQSFDELDAVFKDVLLILSKLVQLVVDNQVQREGSAIVDDGKTESNATALKCQRASKFID
jgi:hypothetical protein